MTGDSDYVLVKLPKDITGWFMETPLLYLLVTVTKIAFAPDSKEQEHGLLFRRQNARQLDDVIEMAQEALNKGEGPLALQLLIPLLTSIRADWSKNWVA